MVGAILHSNTNKATRKINAVILKVIGIVMINLTLQRVHLVGHVTNKKKSVTWLVLVRDMEVNLLVKNFVILNLKNSTDAIQHPLHVTYVRMGTLIAIKIEALHAKIAIQ